MLIGAKNLAFNFNLSKYILKFSPSKQVLKFSMGHGEYLSQCTYLSVNCCLMDLVWNMHGFIVVSFHVSLVE